MINAIGLESLSNKCQGTFYGPASTWQNSKKRQAGSYMLFRAFQILLNEGERQIRPPDLPPPTKWQCKS